MTLHLIHLNTYTHTQMCVIGWLLFCWLVGWTTPQQIKHLGACCYRKIIKLMTGWCDAARPVLTVGGEIHPNLGDVLLNPPSWLFSNNTISQSVLFLLYCHNFFFFLLNKEHHTVYFLSIYSCNSVTVSSQTTSPYLQLHNALCRLFLDTQWRMRIMLAAGTIVRDQGLNSAVVESKNPQHFLWT